MTLTASETCYHCLHADFKAEATGTMRGFARCTKVKTAEDKASYYFGGYKCDKGDYWSGGSAFQPADEIVIQKRREKFEEWRNKRK